MSRALFFILISAISFANAQAPAQPAAEVPPLAGDAKEGERIAKQGTPSGVAACLSCHGAKGEGKSGAGFPRIAGQPQEYMIKQLEDYASGVRANPVMGAISKSLTPEQREKVSAYYANMEVPPTAKEAKVSKAQVQLGEKLARVGDQKIQVQACANCHGPGGIGEAPAIPSLAGQHASYIEAQLKAWKAGQRKNSPAQMAQVAQKLDDQSIKALAAYFQQVQLK